MDSEWSAIRITSGTTIQTVVATSLAHLANPSSGPLILHTLPTTSSSSLQKSRHAGLGKLISIVEIIKREFEQHQKDAAASLAKQADTPADGRNKGKKRAADQLDEAATTDDQEQDKENVGVEKPQYLRLYQYNELSCFERLASNNAQNGQRDDASGGEEENADGEDGEATAGQAGGEPTEAQKRLNDAIENQVIRGRKRPRKKHTPCLKITLYSTRLPAYEAYLASQNKEYTLQQPLKLSQSRKRKRPRRAKAQQELENAPADREIAADEAARDETDGMEVETSSVQNINATPAAVNVQLQQLQRSLASKVSVEEWRVRGERRAMARVANLFLLVVIVLLRYSLVKAIAKPSRSSSYKLVPRSIYIAAGG